MSFGKRVPVAYGGLEVRESNVPAQIILPGGQVVKCQVTDYSESGARLTVASVFGLREAVELRVAGRTYQARITRRGIGQVSVMFTPPPSVSFGRRPGLIDASARLFRS
jgi:hypothetical protein